MDKATKALAQKVAALEKHLHALRDAPRKQHEKTVGDSADSHQEQDEIRQNSPILLHGNPTDKHTGDDSNQKFYNSRKWWKSKSFQWYKDRFEIIALVAGVGYAVVTYLQWRDLRGNFASAQRSWIRVDLGIPAKLDPSASIAILLRNIGKSPALRLEGGVMVQVVDADSSPSFPKGTVNLRKILANMLFPSDEVSFNSGRTPNNPDGTVRPLDAEESRRLAAGDAYLAIWGIIAYRDGFGDHWTRFCTSKTVSVS
jgi:hypothetical protein